jgi:hypothetical protein
MPQISCPQQQWNTDPDDKNAWEDDKKAWKGLEKDERTDSVICFRTGNIQTL